MTTKLASNQSSRLDRFDSFIANILTQVVAEKNDEMLTLLNTYIGEARHGLLFLEPHLASADEGVRILEVGAGLCLLSLFLKSEGLDVVALEPSIGGFEMFSLAKKNILAHDRHDLFVLEKGSEELSKDNDGVFDLIFSNNVLEHIPDLDGAMQGMVNVLSPTGKMVHNCPNYVVPYEPHLNLFVFSFWPSLTKRISHKKISDNLSLWNSLNFVTSFRIVRIGNRLNYKTTFSKALLYDSIIRFNDDKVFRARHSGLFLGKCLSFLLKTGLVNIFRFIPPMMATPMVFEMNSRDSQNPS
ncbi:MAG: 2-polyprenyl-3-methyl-5-hydroxy-6-metoxy-1,4-benzoquinol methylase [Arenicella sp.]|jgi:2-polyprenyl-3-methyl-5-hydroxy-6-metoxy-1,4-benzoquinol methylase